MDMSLWQSVVLGLLCLIGVVLAVGGLPPNRWIGIRTTRTLSNPTDWSRTHRALGALTLAITMAAILLKVLPLHPLAQAIAAIFAMVGSVAVYAIFYRKYAV